MSKAKTAFRPDAVVIPLEKILPIRPLRSKDQAFGKYQAIESSIREVGLIEPLVVHPQGGKGGGYILLDGHLRLEALKRLSKNEALCLISVDDDAFTYNDKVNHLSPIQEHA